MLRMRWLNSLRADIVRPLLGWCAARRISWSQKLFISAAGGWEVVWAGCNKEQSQQSAARPNAGRVGLGTLIPCHAMPCLLGSLSINRSPNMDWSMFFLAELMMALAAARRAATPDLLTAASAHSAWCG